MTDKCPTCNRKIPKRIYTVTGIYQHLGKVHSSEDLLRSKKYIYSVLDQLGATDEKKEFIRQRIENDVNIPHTRDDVYDIVNKVLTLAQNDLMNKGKPLWQFIIDKYIDTGIDETFANFYGKFKLENPTLKDGMFSTQLVSRLLKAIGIKSKTKRTGQSSCMYLKISSEDLFKKIGVLGIMCMENPYSNGIETDYSSSSST